MRNCALGRDDSKRMVAAVSSNNALQNLHGTIALAGAGKMGGAMLTGWLARGLDANRAVVVEPFPSDDIKALAARGVRLNPKDPGTVDTLVVAVKPQMFREAGPALKKLVGPNTLVVSIMAGTPIAALEQVCDGMVVRAMPNTPAAIGRGITVAVAAKNVSAAQRTTADALLRATAVLRPACRRISPQNSRAKPSPAPANCCIAPNRIPRRCARTSPHPAAPRRPRWKC